jgi:hypothetical protein
MLQTIEQEMVTWLENHEHKPHYYRPRKLTLETFLRDFDTTTFVYRVWTMLMEYRLGESHTLERQFNDCTTLELSDLKRMEPTERQLLFNRLIEKIKTVSLTSLFETVFDTSRFCAKRNRLRLVTSSSLEGITILSPQEEESLYEHLRQLSLAAIDYLLGDGSCSRLPEVAAAFTLFTAKTGFVRRSRLMNLLESSHLSWMCDGDKQKLASLQKEIASHCVHVNFSYHLERLEQKCEFHYIVSYGYLYPETVKLQAKEMVDKQIETQFKEAIISKESTSSKYKTVQSLLATSQKLNEILQ